MADIADSALNVVDHVRVRILWSQAVVDGEDRVACWREEVGTISFATALAGSALVAAAVDDDDNRVRAGAFGGIVVHGKLLTVGCAVEDAVLSGCARGGL